MRYDLTDLRLFALVVEHGSLTKGASAAGMSLAAASQRIKGMEDLLSVPLLKREPRGVVPTPAGQTVLRHGRLIISQMERMHGELGAYGKGLRGTLQVLSNAAAMVRLLPAAIREFLVLHPHMNVVVEEVGPSDTVKAIVDGRGEFAVCSYAQPDQLQHIDLGKAELVVVAPRNHEIARRETVSFSDVVSLPFVALNTGAFPVEMAGLAKRLGYRVNYRARLSTYPDVIDLVEAGIGIAILPQVAASRFCTSNVRMIRLSDAWAHRQQSLAALDFGALSVQASILVEELIRQASLLRMNSKPTAGELAGV